jgi:hypothetical protein
VDTKTRVACFLGLFVALGLTACAVVLPPNEETSSAPSASVSATSSHLNQPVSPRPPTISAGTVVATGRFSGRARGSARVVVDEDGRYAVLIVLSSGSVPAGVRVAIGANARVFNCAAVSGINLSLGGVRPREKPQRFLLPRGYAPHAEYDPSFLHAVALTQDTDQLTDANCAEHTYSTAALTWALPNMRPSLTVEDEGVRSGARGTVTTIADQPARYEVAPGDTFASIAARLNVSVDDLFYLNPQRGIGEDPSAKSDEVLNLLQAGR